MKERLIQLLDLEQLSPSKFADIIGVQRSSISHVLSGRNNPSFDFLQKTLKAFPGLNASWLMMGEGTMYEQMGRKVSGNLFDAPERVEEPFPARIKEREEEKKDTGESEAPLSSGEKPEMRPEQALQPEDSENEAQAGVLAREVSPGKRKVVQVLVIYDDDTFRSYSPSN